VAGRRDFNKKAQRNTRIVSNQRNNCRRSQVNKSGLIEGALTAELLHSRPVNSQNGSRLILAVAQTHESLDPPQTPCVAFRRPLSAASIGRVAPQPGIWTGVHAVMSMKKQIILAIILAAALIVGARMHAQSAEATAPPSAADIKMLAKGGISDEVILSQIRNSHAVYHLSAADILALKNSGVSQKVIDFMINTAETSSSPPPSPPTSAPPTAATPVPPPSVTSPPPAASAAPVQESPEGTAPPPVVVEQAVPAPGPEYVWVAGAWVWHRHHWEWVGGHWVLPPYRGAIWIGGHWERRGGRFIWIDGYWR